MYEDDEDDLATPTPVAAQRPVGALAAVTVPEDPLAGLDPDTLMREARKFSDPSAVSRARAAGFLKPTNSRHFSANYYNALSGADAAAAKQEELVAQYLPVVQRAALARQAQKVAAAQRQRTELEAQRGLLTSTAAASLMDPALSPERLRASVGSLVTQGRVQGALAESFLESLPKDPAELRRSLTQQSIAASDPNRATKVPSVEKYREGEVGFAVDPVTGVRTKVGEGEAKPSDVSRLLRELMELPPGDPRAGVYQAAIRRATTHPPAASMTVNAEKPLINSFMDVIGKSAGAERDAALSTKTSLDTAGRLLEVLKSPNIFTGPAAQVAITAAQLAEVGNFGGKDNRERLANTQLAIQALAQLELDAAGQMKGQGAITDVERQLLKRVAGGAIDMTKAELQTLAMVARRNGKLRIERYNKNAARLAKLPGLESVAPLLRVEMDDMDGGPIVEYDAQGRPVATPTK